MFKTTQNTLLTRKKKKKNTFSFLFVSHVVTKEKCVKPLLETLQPTLGFFELNHSNFVSLSKTRLRGTDEGRAPFIQAASQGEEDESHLAHSGTAWSHLPFYRVSFPWTFQLSGRMGGQKLTQNTHNYIFLSSCATVNEAKKDLKCVVKCTVHFDLIH